jgi:hypothetical protein
VGGSLVSESRPISPLRDAETLAIVLDGWAFDPARSADEARTVIVGAEGGARVLRPVQASRYEPSHEGGNR